MLKPVPLSPEFYRIEQLPRRIWTVEQGESLSQRLTPLLATPGGLRRGVTLWPMQALAIQEAFDMQGFFGAISVGSGKTLISWLLPFILQARKPLLILPASLIDETYTKFAVLQKHWISPRPMSLIESYSQFSQVNSHDLFERIQPDLVVCDEVDMLRNEDIAVVQRLGRYLEEHPGCRFVGLTGTILRKSIKDFAHLLVWALGDRAPVPRRYVDLEHWSNALDHKVDFMKRCPPGALLRFANKEDWEEAGSDELDAARLGFRRRLQETPGILTADDQSCDQPITIRLLQAPEDKLLDEPFKQLRRKAIRPDGWELEDPLSVRAVGIQLGVGFYFCYDPLPPTEWIEKRRAWTKFVRDRIGSRAKAGHFLDTKLQVAREFADHPAHIAWREIEPTFKPNSVARWLSGSVLEMAKNWLAANGPALVWCEYIPFCEALSKLTRVKYFGAGGLSEDGQHIHQHTGKESAILGVRSNSRGRNLQDRWHRALVVAPPQPATAWEQGPLGRIHRSGQDKPVQIDVIVSSAESLHAVNMAYRESHFVERTQGQTQKLLIANVDSSGVVNYAGHRWALPEKG